jgi:DNA-binding HxlR family transcriptional regulator
MATGTGTLPAEDAPAEGVPTAEETPRAEATVLAGEEPPEGVSPACRARAILNRVGDKWAIYVVSNLSAGPRRFTELHRSIDGIASRMLTVTLRGLERDGIVTRTVHAVIPPRVDYELTPLGKTLLDTIGQLVDWADTHVDEVEAARAAYDARACPPPCSDDDAGR